MRVSGVQKELRADQDRPTANSMDFNQPKILGHGGRVLVTGRINALQIQELTK